MEQLVVQPKGLDDVVDLLLLCLFGGPISFWLVVDADEVEK